jgi:hypothetical protein
LVSVVIIISDTPGMPEKLERLTDLIRRRRDLGEKITRKIESEVERLLAELESDGDQGHV